MYCRFDDYFLFASLLACTSIVRAILRRAFNMPHFLSPCHWIMNEKMFCHSLVTVIEWRVASKARTGTRSRRRAKIDAIKWNSMNKRVKLKAECELRFSSVCAAFFVSSSAGLGRNLLSTRHGIVSQKRRRKVVNWNSLRTWKRLLLFSPLLIN